jgi:hypothetical protein
MTTQFQSRTSSESSPSISIQRISPSPPVVNENNKQQEEMIIERKVSLTENPEERFPIRIGTNIEIGRLEMKDLAERELNNLCEFFYQDLLEEIIQSDFEKPSIPEVILSVITDLTNDDEDVQQQQHEEDIEFENDPINSIYCFNQGELLANSPAVINTNGDIYDYYTRVRQAVPNDNSEGTISSDQNIALIPIIDQTSNSLQVNFYILKCFLLYFQKCL